MNLRKLWVIPAAFCWLLGDRVAAADAEAPGVARVSLIEGQVSSQHATLASGIDAIALEVERLGEGQRFMSKVLTTPEARVRPQG